MVPNGRVGGRRAPICISMDALVQEGRLRRRRKPNLRSRFFASASLEIKKAERFSAKQMLHAARLPQAGGLSAENLPCRIKCGVGTQRPQAQLPEQIL